ncbi:hypothetical protein [Amycolatopsis sp. NPDC059021]|uniref:phthiocerol/phthiodiolone dimycocerosyl transferase family protein n=1 Tax=Amycolatopsis sp. NPDC059021 TaxID=3346704 RepID=UPI003672A36B
MTMVERPLNYLELAHFNRVVIMAAEYEGDLDPEALDRAFRALCAAHPVLRARIRGAGRDAVMRVEDGHVPELLILDEAPDVLTKIVELPWDASQAVADLVLVRGERHGYLALRADHSIVDANGWLGYLRELLRLFAAGDAGSAEPVGTLPAPPAELFHERLGLIPYDRRLFHTAGPSILDGEGGLLSGYLRLDEEETSWIRRTARRYGTTVHGLVSGAILLTQRAFAGGRDPVPMFSVSPVDFRGRVEPPVGELETTNFMLSYVAEVDVSTRMSPVLVGQSVKAQMDAALESGEGVRAGAPLKSALDRNLSFALVSNLGVVPEFPMPDGVEVVETHILNTVDDTLFPGYYVSTYRGRLTVLYVLTKRFFTEEDAEAIARELREQLLIIGASS